MPYLYEFTCAAAFAKLSKALLIAAACCWWTLDDNLSMVSVLILQSILRLVVVLDVEDGRDWYIAIQGEQYGSLIRKSLSGFVSTYSLLQGMELSSFQSKYFVTYGLVDV